MDSNGAVEFQPEPDLLDITKRVQDYNEIKTTDELYDFGKMLLLEEVDRAHWIDSKAATLAGFCGAVVALLLSTSSNWKRVLAQEPDWSRVVVFIGIGLVLMSSALAFIALINRTFSWIDEKDEWFQKDYLEFPDFLRRSYVLTMYQATRSHGKKNDTKSNYLTAAQLALFLGGSLLAIPLMTILWTILKS
jgi:hypothetical protein